jgi:hypothetical protein
MKKILGKAISTLAALSMFLSNSTGIAPRYDISNGAVGSTPLSAVPLSAAPGSAFIANPSADTQTPPQDPLWLKEYCKSGVVDTGAIPTYLPSINMKNLPVDTDGFSQQSLASQYVKQTQALADMLRGMTAHSPIQMDIVDFDVVPDGSAHMILNYDNQWQQLSYTRDESLISQRRQITEWDPGQYSRVASAARGLEATLEFWAIEIDPNTLDLNSNNYLRIGRDFSPNPARYCRLVAYLAPFSSGSMTPDRFWELMGQNISFTLDTKSDTLSLGEQYPQIITEAFNQAPLKIKMINSRSVNELYYNPATLENLRKAYPDIQVVYGILGYAPLGWDDGTGPDLSQSNKLEDNNDESYYPAQGPLWLKDFCATNPQDTDTSALKPYRVTVNLTPYTQTMDGFILRYSNPAQGQIEYQTFLSRESTQKGYALVDMLSRLTGIDPEQMGSFVYDNGVLSIMLKEQESYDPRTRITTLTTKEYVINAEIPELIDDRLMDAVSGIETAIAYEAIGYDASKMYLADDGPTYYKRVRGSFYGKPGTYCRMASFLAASQGTESIFDIDRIWEYFGKAERIQLGYLDGSGYPYLKISALYAWNSSLYETSSESTIYLNKVTQGLDGSYHNLEDDAPNLNRLMEILGDPLLDQPK